MPTYFGVKLDRVLTYRPYLKALHKKLSTRVSLLWRLSSSGWGAGAKTLRTASSSLIYSTAEYCAPPWCRSTHTRLIDSVLNDALRIVTGCLRIIPSDNLPVLSGIQPAELRHQGARLSMANRSSIDPGHILHGQLTELRAASKKRRKSRRPFVPAPRKLMHKSELGIRAAQRTNLTWDTEYSKSTSVLGVYIPRVSIKTHWNEFIQNTLDQTQSPASWS